MGCSPVLASAVRYPKRVLSMILFWPIGGPKHRLSSHQRFAEHLGFVSERGLHKVVELVRETGKPFNADPRGGALASVLPNDEAFAEAYAAVDSEPYHGTVAALARTLFDRDTPPGA